MRRLTHLIVLAAFMFSCGGHWYVLQGVAWLNMIHAYAQTVPLSQAVTMTLSGKHPCALCAAIAEKKAADDRAKIFAWEKYDKKFTTPVAADLVPRAASLLIFPRFAPSLSTRDDSPPTPPPRPALV